MLFVSRKRNEFNLTVAVGFIMAACVITLDSSVNGSWSGWR